MVFCTYLLSSTSSTTREILDALRLVVIPLQYNKSCLKTNIWQDTNDFEKIMVFEVWKSIPELEKYLRSPLYKRMLEIIEMSSEKPEIRFMDCETALGLEWLQKVIVA